MKIISLVPSITYTLIDLGLKDQLIGRTKFCNLPQQEVENIKIIGGTKNPHLNKIIKENPNLILANKEENRKQDILDLKEKTDAEILVTNVFNLESNIEMILTLGKKTQTTQKANLIADQIIKNFKALEKIKSSKKLCTYLIWKNPYMTVGGDTFIHSMLEAAGYKNYFSQQKRYPTLDLNQIPPQTVLLSSEPYPFNHKHKTDLEKEYPQHEFICVNGNYFSWFGSFILKSPKYFLSL